MCMMNIVAGLISTASESTITHKHAAVAVRNKRAITPMFTNTLRSYVSGVKVDSLHAEMAVLHHLVRTSVRSKSRRNSYLFRGYIETPKIEEEVGGHRHHCHSEWSTRQPTFFETL